MNALTLIFTFTLALTASNGMAYAAMDARNMTGMEMPAASSTTKHQGVGVVKTIDAKAGKIQLAHQPIASLGWSAMTMWFALREPLPKSIQIGDSVRFDLAQAEGKRWLITKIVKQ